MNCKQGDLAILIRSAMGNEGKLVKVIAPIGQMFFLSTGALFMWEIEGVGWSAPIHPFLSSAHAPDAWLRPIRDPGEDAQDETLSWVPAPVKEVAHG